MLVFLLCSLPLAAQVDAGTAAKLANFKEAEAQAPKGFPTLFRVNSAAVDPGQLFGTDRGCTMRLETAGQLYEVTGLGGFTADCTVFQPGSMVWGHVHRILGTVVDVLDTRGLKKPKSRRYKVEAIALVDPATQQ